MSQLSLTFVPGLYKPISRKVLYNSIKTKLFDSLLVSPVSQLVLWYYIATELWAEFMGAVFQCRGQKRLLEDLRGRKVFSFIFLCLMHDSFGYQDAHRCIYVAMISSVICSLTLKRQTILYSQIKNTGDTTGCHLLRTEVWNNILVLPNACQGWKVRQSSWTRFKIIQVIQVSNCYFLM